MGRSASKQATLNYEDTVIIIKVIGSPDFTLNEYNTLTKETTILGKVVTHSSPDDINQLPTGNFRIKGPHHNYISAGESSAYAGINYITSLTFDMHLKRTTNNISFQVTHNYEMHEFKDHHIIYNPLRAEVPGYVIYSIKTNGGPIAIIGDGLPFKNMTPISLITLPGELVLFVTIAGKLDVVVSYDAQEWTYHKYDNIVRTLNEKQVRINDTLRAHDQFKLLKTTVVNNENKFMCALIKLHGIHLFSSDGEYQDYLSCVPSTEHHRVIDCVYDETHNHIVVVLSKWVDGHFTFKHRLGLLVWERDTSTGGWRLKKSNIIKEIKSDNIKKGDCSILTKSGNIVIKSGNSSERNRDIYIIDKESLKIVASLGASYAFLVRRWYDEWINISLNSMMDLKDINKFSRDILVLILRYVA